MVPVPIFFPFPNKYALRIEFAGAVYHITSRGNARQAIFLDEKDFADFSRVLCSVVKRYHFILHAFCLMNNHYHLLIETPYANLSRGMRQLNGLYTQRLGVKRGLGIIIDRRLKGKPRKMES
jgi:REP element-mobilizing transposase RayT